MISGRRHCSFGGLITGFVDPNAIEEPDEHIEKSLLEDNEDSADVSTGEKLDDEESEDSSTDNNDSDNSIDPEICVEKFTLLNSTQKDFRCRIKKHGRTRKWLKNKFNW